MIETSAGSSGMGGDDRFAQVSSGDSVWNVHTFGFSNPFGWATNSFTRGAQAQVPFEGPEVDRPL